MYAQLKKDDAPLQKKSSDRHRENTSYVDRNSDLLSGETTAGFTRSPSQALPPTGQGQLPMQCKGLADSSEPAELSGQLIQRRVSNTGLPDNLKTGIENLSGYSMDDVRVHYNSSKPAQLQAHAYTQGTSIHVAPGQEQHLPHEAWHVVQQKQGRVKPTLQMKGKVNVNDDAGLEREADLMGARAFKNQEPSTQKITVSNGNKEVIQGNWKTEKLKSFARHAREKGGWISEKFKQFKRFVWWERGPRPDETMMARNNRRDTNRLKTTGILGFLMAAIAVCVFIVAPEIVAIVAAAGALVLSSYIIYRAIRKHKEADEARGQAQVREEDEASLGRVAEDGEEEVVEQEPEDEEREVVEQELRGLEQEVVEKIDEVASAVESEELQQRSPEEVKKAATQEIPQVKETIERHASESAGTTAGIQEVLNEAANEAETAIEKVEDTNESVFGQLLNDAKEYLKNLF